MVSSGACFIEDPHSVFPPAWERSLVKLASVEHYRQIPWLNILECVFSLKHNGIKMASSTFPS